MQWRLHNNDYTIPEQSAFDPIAISVVIEGFHPNGGDIVTLPF
jgi:hypothetical protein